MYMNSTHSNSSCVRYTARIECITQARARASAHNECTQCEEFFVPRAECNPRDTPHNFVHTMYAPLRRFVRRHFAWLIDDFENLFVRIIVIVEAAVWFSIICEHKTINSLGTCALSALMGPFFIFTIYIFIYFVSFFFFFVVLVRAFVSRLLCFDFNLQHIVWIATSQMKNVEQCLRALIQFWLVQHCNEIAVPSLAAHFISSAPAVTFLFTCERFVVFVFASVCAILLVCSMGWNEPSIILFVDEIDRLIFRCCCHRRRRCCCCRFWWESVSEHASLFGLMSEFMFNVNAINNTIIMYLGVSRVSRLQK